MIKTHIDYRKFSINFLIVALIVTTLIWFFVVINPVVQENLREEIQEQTFMFAKNLNKNVQENLEEAVIDFSESIEDKVIDKVRDSKEFSVKQITLVEKAFDDSNFELKDEVRDLTNVNETKFSPVRRIIDDIFDKAINSIIGKIILFIFIFSIILLLKVPIFFLASLIVLIYFNILERKKINRQVEKHSEKKGYSYSHKNDEN